MLKKFQSFVPTIEHQETESWFMKSIAKPLMRGYYAVVRRVVYW